MILVNWNDLRLPLDYEARNIQEKKNPLIGI